MRFFTAISAAAVWLCSAPASAVVVGEDAPAYRPHLVMVLNDRGGFCSGVVVARDAILTAGHCTTGAIRLHWKDAAGRPVLAEPGRVVVHPEFRDGAEKARVRSVDLAIIRTRTPLPAEFRPVALAGPGSPVPEKDATLRVVGYGLGLEWDDASAGKLRSADIPVVTPYGPGRLLVWLSAKTGSGACRGDSGGGIFDPAGTLAAITAWSEGNGSRRCGALTQGVLVAPQRAWIDRTLAAAP
jgi:hypothetical protein